MNSATVSAISLKLASSVMADSPSYERSIAFKPFVMAALVAAIHVFFLSKFVEGPAIQVSKLGSSRLIRQLAQLEFLDLAG
jgi:hypothetical protein